MRFLSRCWGLFLLFGCGWARLRCVFCPGAGACFFSFRGFRLVTSPPCGGGFFAGFASGFRWCLAVLSPWPGGCCFGRVWTRLRCVFCPGAGACFFSFRGFRLVTSPPCGGGFFAGFASGFRWCLAVLSPSPGGCCFGRVRARLRRVFCLRAGACLFSFRGWARLRHVFCLRRVAKNCGTLASFAACCWNLLLPRLAFGTFFLQGCAAKLLGRKIWRSIGATQRFDRNAGGPKLWQVGWIRGLPSGLAFANLKILRTEFLARHRRHAAFRLRRGGARAKSSRYIAPGFVAFAGRGAQKP